MQQIEHGIYIENSYPGVTVGAILLPMGTILVDAPLRAEDARAWLNVIYNLGAKTKPYAGQPGCPPRPYTWVQGPWSAPSSPIKRPPRYSVVAHLSSKVKMLKAARCGRPMMTWLARAGHYPISPLPIKSRLTGVSRKSSSNTMPVRHLVAPGW